MDTWLAIASRREVREYDTRPIADDVVRRILDAGRLAGSARNKQPWRFVIVEETARRTQLADAVYAPSNVSGAALVVGIVGRGGLDAGRCAQNMLLAAWNDGVGSVPNGIKDAEAGRAALDAGDDEEIAIVLSFGYPRQARDATRRSADEWSARADRRPLDELVTRL